MVDNLFWKIVWVVVWAITAFYTFSGNMMMGMYWMAGGMFAEAVVSLVYHFVGNKEKSISMNHSHVM